MINGSELLVQRGKSNTASLVFYINRSNEKKFIYSSFSTEERVEFVEGVC
jgi:hypothetical protein